MKKPPGSGGPSTRHIKEPEGRENRGGEGTTPVKPWSCARARLIVKTPPHEATSGRRVTKLRRDREALETGLTRTPYVEILWHGEDNAWRSMVGLVDTGADWSLVEESELDGEERKELVPSSMSGKGVTDTEIPIIGEVWRDVSIGGLLVKDQRFIVVSRMITPVILGADFWGRFGQFSLNFRDSKLTVGEVTVDLFDAARNGKRKEGQVKVVAERQVCVAPFTEMVVRGTVQGGEVEDGDEIFFEPVGDDKDLCSSPYTVCSIEEGGVYLRVANIGSEVYTIRKGALMGTGDRDFEVRSARKSTSVAGAKPHAGKRLEVGKMCGDQLDNTQKGEMARLLTEFQDVFYQGGELGTVHLGVEHRIRLKENTAPVAHRPRRLSPQEQEEVKEEIDDLIRMGVVRESNSPWAAPIVCARKSDGKLRLAIDYRGLNGVSLPATLHPIPRIDDLFDRLGEASFFSVMDAKSGYHQLPLNSKESELTAFVVPWGQYEFMERTPFGLKGAGYSFQRFMSTLLGECNFKDALCYLDDILVWSKTWEEHLVKLRKVLAKIRVANLTLGPSKCRFGLEEIQYLGVTIRNGMLSIGEQRVETLRNLPRPTTVTELRSALGAFSYVQRWIPGLAEINRPLNEAIRGTGRRKLQWTDEMEGAFVELKERTAKAVELRIPDMGEPFTLVTDGSDRGVGAMLAQGPEDGEHLIPVAFYHHTLSDAEKRYSVTDKELLAVFLAVQKFRVYLGAPFTLITDHSAVRFMKTLNANDEKGRRGRWVEYLQQFDMELIHRAGASKELSVADYLSRVSYNGTVGGVAAIKATEEGDIPIKGFLSVEELKEKQRGDEEVKGWIEEIEQDGPRVGDGTSIVDNLVMDEKGLLRARYGKGKRGVTTSFGNAERLKVVVPRALVQDVIRFVHDSPLAGHMGYKRTYKRCRNAFWWKGMGIDIREYIKTCEQCGKNKHENHPNVAPLQLMDIPDCAFDKLQVDFLGPFPQSTAHGYRYALQIQDILSRFLDLIPAERDDAETASRLLFEDWVCRYGPPKVVQSDRGTHFASRVFEKMCTLAGIKHRMGAPGHAQSQGQVERQNQLMNQVRCLTENHPGKWPRALPRISFAHNTSDNDTTGLSPYQIVFASAPRTMETVALEVWRGGVEETPVQRYERAVEIKDQLQGEARWATIEAQQQRADDCPRRGSPYKVGDKVRIKIGVAERGKLGGKKMAPLYSDVYIVDEVHGEGWTYTLIPENGIGRKKIRHYNGLKSVKEAVVEDNLAVHCEWREVEGPEPLEPPAINQEQGGGLHEETPQGDAPITEIREEEPLTLRRSLRRRAPPARLRMDMAPGGKRYNEESVPLAEDMQEEGEPPD